MKQPSPKQITFFETRTGIHKMLVLYVCSLLTYQLKSVEARSKLLERGLKHDDSKYSKAEYVPYVWLSEFYRAENMGNPFTYPPGVEVAIDEACEQHVSSNRHHPEFHKAPKDMNTIDLLEMVADWTAMALELGEEDGSARSWADKTIGDKYDFDEKQTAFIYNAIESLERFAITKYPHVMDRLRKLNDSL